MEWLTRTINNAVSNRLMRGFQNGVFGRYINTLLFADDILIFTNGCKKSLEAMTKIIKDFCHLSGQQLNNDKSFIFCSEDMSNTRQKQILEVTKFHKGTFPVKYLGVPLYVGRTKIEYFKDLEEKVQKRMGGWMKNIISFGGKVTLIESVLNSVGIHCMSVLPIPKTVLNRIGGLIRRFLWDKGDGKRRHWVGWEKICREKSVGGLGIKNLEDIMLSLKGKLAWSFLNSDSLWAMHARRKFHHGVSGSCIWNSIDHLIIKLQEETRWIIGQGATSVKTFCLKLGFEPPEDLGHLNLQEIHSNSNDWESIACFLFALCPHVGVARLFLP
ncbi:hypothetical protein QQ045_033422 [Rhodiola kirilowii]